jgi:hypothetical protein
MVARQGTRMFGVAAATALLLLAPAASPASAAGKRAVLFEPAKTSPKAVTFHVRGLDPHRVLRASLVRRGQERRRISRDRARRVVRRGVLRVPVRGGHRRMARIVSHTSARRSTLWVRRAVRTSVKLKVVADTRAPETRITSGPDATTEASEAEFRFSADEKRSTFECRVDSFDWRSCNSPISYTEVPEGDHAFSVRARDRYGNVDATPAARSWTVRPADGDAGTTEPDAGTEVPAGDQQAPAPDPNVLLFDSFTGEDGVITNHYAFWSPGDETAFRSDVWEMESGCALRHDNTLWTGVPTSNLPNKDCSNGSGSETFRLWTKQSFGDVSVSFSLRNNGYAVGSQGERTWDGIKIWLRRQGGTGSVGLYTAEVNRRQGNIMIQKKCGGSTEYHILSQARPEGSDASIGEWEKVGGLVQNQPDGSVRLALVRHGQTVLEATDNGVGCAPITSAGRVGIRGDSTNFNADDFLVAPAV